MTHKHVDEIRDLTWWQMMRATIAENVEKLDEAIQSHESEIARLQAALADYKDMRIEQRCHLKTCDESIKNHVTYDEATRRIAQIWDRIDKNNPPSENPERTYHFATESHLESDGVRAAVRSITDDGFTYRDYEGDRKFPDDYPPEYETWFALTEAELADIKTYIEVNASKKGD